MILSPKFWQQQKGWQSCLLYPFSKLYEFGVYVNTCSIQQKTPPVPVICIGNLTLGGAGKTPTAIAIAQVLRKENIKIHFISRGYGRTLKDIRQVNLNKDTSSTVGDEPLLLAQAAPTWVGPNRYDLIVLAHQEGAQVTILDDGLQNPSIRKNLSILVVDSKLGFGNGLVFPAGPLRISLEEGLQDIDAVLVIGPSNLALEEGIQQYSNAPIFRASPALEVPKNIGKKVIVFAGIAYPSKFFEGLKALGFDILEAHSFPDHHHLSEKEFQKLLKKSQKYKAPLVTTQKDFVRLDTKQRPLVTPIPYHLKLEDAFIQFMKQKTNELI